MGVPTLGCDCRVCTSADLRDRRTRPSVMVEYNGRVVLIDTTPDFHAQAVRERIARVDAVFYTHAHADHIGALPLVHQAFPSAPIYTSRGTALLMEVMLADALKVMTRRAVEEMEIPLYPEALVASMLTRVRPLPVDEPHTLSVLPGITIHASRAGHIAGAVSLGFVATEGSLVVSGDISSTPQRTVLGALPMTGSSEFSRLSAGGRVETELELAAVGKSSGAYFSNIS